MYRIRHHDPMEKNMKNQNQINLNRQAALPVIDDLNREGFKVVWISDLYAKKLNYKKAIPVLIKWLPLIDNLDVKESIIRALSVHWAKPTAALPLIHEFENANPESIGLKWAIANGLSIVADDSVYTEIVNLVRNKKHGKAREMLALALGNMKNLQASDVLIELLNDEVVFGHAIIALGRLKSRKAYLKIEKYIDHPKAWVRKEAKKALSLIEKGSK